MLSQADLILATSPVALPENRSEACRELLGAAMALADDLIKDGNIGPAALLGSKGGSETAKRHGAEHYRNMAASRKTKGGGRPRKSGGSSPSTD
jgi:hypothetical protein